ncbi:hypothetical protein GEMRC1_005383 [Eukaryota sp. GEM-RC1]
MPHDEEVSQMLEQLGLGVINERRHVTSQPSSVPDYPPISHHSPPPTHSSDLPTDAVSLLQLWEAEQVYSPSISSPTPKSSPPKRP